MGGAPRTLSGVRLSVNVRPGAPVVPSMAWRKLWRRGVDAGHAKGRARRFFGNNGRSAWPGLDVVALTSLAFGRGGASAGAGCVEGRTTARQAQQHEPGNCELFFSLGFPAFVRRTKLTPKRSENDFPISCGKKIENFTAQFPLMVKRPSLVAYFLLSYFQNQRQNMLASSRLGNAGN